MVLLFCVDPSITGRIQSVVDSGILRRVERHKILNGLPDEATALVVALYGEACLTAETMLARVGPPGSPVSCIAVIPTHADAMRAGFPACVDEGVCLSALEDELPVVLSLLADRLRRTRLVGAPTVRHRLARRLDEDSSFSPFVRHILIRVLLAEQPLRTVSDIVRATRRPRSTVQYHWTREVTGSGGPTLFCFLRWVMLLHCVESAGASPSLSAAAARLGVGVRPLRTEWRRLFGERQWTRDGAGPALADHIYRRLGGHGARAHTDRKELDS
jgi:hypothetical protein